MSQQLFDQIHKEVGTLHGWTTPERGVEMAQLILSEKPKACVEIGVFGGRTLVAQAMALRHNNQGHIYGIDPYTKDAALEGENEANQKWWSELDIESIFTGATEALIRLALTRWATIIRFPSQQAHALFDQIDLLNIDGNHSEIASCRDVELWVPKLRPGCWIWFDDSDWPSTQLALTKMADHCTLERDCGHWRLYKKK